MKIMRVKKSFRTSEKAAGRRGLNEGELVPDTHPFARKFPSYFESAEDHVSHAFPDLVETTSAEPGSKRRRTKPKTEPKIEPSQPADATPREESDNEA